MDNSPTNQASELTTPAAATIQARPGSYVRLSGGEIATLIDNFPDGATVRVGRTTWYGQTYVATATAAEWAAFIRAQAAKLRKGAAALRRQAAEYNASTGGRAVANKGRNNSHELNDGGLGRTFRGLCCENSESAHHRELLKEAAADSAEAAALLALIPKAPRKAPALKLRIKSVKWVATFPGHYEISNIPAPILAALGWRYLRFAPGVPQRVYAGSTLVFTGVLDDLIPFINSRLSEGRNT